MPIDNPDIKVVEARYKEEPFFIGIGVSKQREKRVASEVSVPRLAGKGEYQAQKDIEWQLLYNPKALPHGFMPIEALRELMASTTALTSGSMAPLSGATKYIETDQIPLEKVTEEDYWEFLEAYFGSEQEPFKSLKKKEPKKT